MHKIKTATDVSKSFCLAKWLHLSLHLDRGSGHSCYHTPEVIIPIDQLSGNPSALHNTYDKKLEREEMIKGKWPKGCEFCIRHESSSENNSGNSLSSDRNLKSSSHWAAPFLEEVLQNPEADWQPTYLEVGFSNQCQMKCTYCGPHNSSAWEAELKAKGNYTNRVFPQVPNQADSAKYREAFWEWWPKLSKSLKVMRITGGEPLLSDETFKVMEWFVENPSPELEFAINSNLSVSAALFSKFLDALAKLQKKNAVGNIKVITSLEAIGEAAVYIRSGIQLELFWQNVRKLCLLNPSVIVSITATVQALSVNSFIEFIEHLLTFREQLGFNKITFDPSAIVQPNFMRIELLPAVVKDRFYDDLKNYVQKNHSRLKENERLKVSNILSLLKMPVDQDQILKARVELHRYFSEYDKMRGLDFVKTFPQMRSFWEESAALAKGLVTE